VNLTSMLKSVLTSLLIYCSLVAGSNTAESEGESFSLPIPSPTPVSKGILISLDANELTLPCPAGHRGCGNGPSPDLVIDVKVEPIRGRKKTTYLYTVSGGRVIGDGPSVRWDLSGVSPGSYKITVEERGARRVRSNTATAFVFEDICICDYECPMISVESSKEFGAAQELISFTANVSGGSSDEFTLFWSLSAGEIVAGQGTPEIKVRIPAKSDTEFFTATLEVKSIDPAFGCPTTAAKRVYLRPICDCPGLQISASADVVQAGEFVTFSVKANDNSENKRKFDWSISGGEIIEGQETATIRVRTTSAMAGTTLTVAVELDEGQECACENGVSETISVK
jgi:hypothetical protein